MKFSALEEYGLRCILQIAREGSGGSLTIQELADREAMSAPHVAKVMRLLRKAGLVESTRGQHGGYSLARPAADIDAAEVLAALGERLYSSDFCAKHAGKDFSPCVHSVDCSIRSLWSGLDRVVERILRQCRLSDLLQPEGVVRAMVDQAAESLEESPA